MKAKIQSLISELDTINDGLLIALLNDKMDLSIKTHNFTFEKRSYDIAATNLKKMVYEEMCNNDHKLQKANRILPECDKCPYSVTKYSTVYNVEYKNYDENSKVCKSCLGRTHILWDYIDKIKDKYTNLSGEIITDEVIKTRVMITKVKNKLQSIKQPL